MFAGEKYNNTKKTISFFVQQDVEDERLGSCVAVIR